MVGVTLVSFDKGLLRFAGESLCLLTRWYRFEGRRLSVPAGAAVGVALEVG